MNICEDDQFNSIKNDIVSFWLLRDYQPLNFDFHLFIYLFLVIIGIFIYLLIFKIIIILVIITFIRWLITIPESITYILYLLLISNWFKNNEQII